MSAFLITYDLSAPAYEDDLLGYIKSSSQWARVTESSYVVIAKATASQIVADMRQIANDQITVYAFEVRRPYVGFGLTEVNSWLDNHLPR